MSIYLTTIIHDSWKTLKRRWESCILHTRMVFEVNRIKDLRACKSMRQSDLAKLLNVQPTAISNYELGIREMDAPTINRLCDIFGCSADYLLGRSPVPTPELSPEEETLLLSWRAAPAEIRAIIDTALAPYKQAAPTSETA